MRKGTSLKLLAFCGQMLANMNRSVLNITIVGMVKQAQLEDNANDDLPGMKFNWEEDMVGILISGFGIGYFFTQYLGGRLSEMIGFKRVYGVAIFVSSLLTLLTPIILWFVPYPAWLFFAIRILQGVFLGPTFPSVHAMAAQWVAPKKRGSFISLVYFGNAFSMSTSNIIFSWLIQYINWESCYFAVSVLSVFWLYFWWCYVYDSPDKHPTIAKYEYDEIMGSIGNMVQTKKRPPVPFRAMFSTPAVYGIIATDITNQWGLTVFMTSIPIYMANQLNTGVIKVGWYTAIPMACRFVGAYLSAKFAHWLMESRGLKTLAIRRLFNIISQCVPAICFTAIILSGSHVEGVMMALSIGFFFNGAITCSHVESPLDLAPNFAATLMGLSNTLAGGLTSFIVPFGLGGLLKQSDSIVVWTWFFAVTTALYFIGSGIYCCLITAELQPWNDPKPKLFEESHNRRDIILVSAFTNKKDIQVIDVEASTESNAPYAISGRSGVNGA